MGMKHRIHHGLEADLATKVIDKAMEGYSARFPDYHPTFTWETERRGRLAFTAKGLNVVGEIELVGREITVDLEVPFILRIFKGKAMKVIEDEVNAWVVRAKNGELD